MSTITRERPLKTKVMFRHKVPGSMARQAFIQPEAERNPLTQLRKALKWSRAQLARVLNCSDRAIVNWEQGEPISAVYASKLREIQSVHDELKELMKPEEVGRWLTTEMEEFDGQSPADVIRRGETGRLWRSLFYLRTGAPD